MSFDIIPEKAIIILLQSEARPAAPHSHTQIYLMDEYYLPHNFLTNKTCPLICSPS